MLGDVVGYCIVKEGAKGFSPVDLSEFYGKPIRAFEINKSTNAVLLLNNAATSLGTFDLSDCVSYFECQEVNNILTPPNLNTIEQIAYLARVMSVPKNRVRDMKF
jgi:hypothetical protein